MDRTLALFLGIVALLTAVPAWLAGSILARRAKADGEPVRDWIPFGLLPYALTRFRHPHRGAIVAAYVAANLVSWGALAALLGLSLAGR
ncbi:MAG TPA: hypothetical protein VNO22_13430 [Planctomycetota bacterium]|nr:hypothetical protein [Planctomycetota bacterium]